MRLVRTRWHEPTHEAAPSSPVRVLQPIPIHALAGVHTYLRTLVFRHSPCAHAFPQNMVRQNVVLWPSISVTSDEHGATVYTEEDGLFDVVSHHDLPPEEDWDA